MATRSFDDTFRVTNEGIDKFISNFNENKTVKVIRRPRFVKTATRSDMRRLLDLVETKK